jgi:HPt (histidine-containing phosphotransfer) domain-containing protein
MSIQPDLTASAPAPAVLDAQALQHLRDLDPQGGTALLARVVQAFEKSLERLLPDLDKARGSQPNLVVVRHVCHTLKSSTASLGALELSRRCAQIEAQARDGRAEGLDKLLDAMHDELARVRVALAALLTQSA